MASRLRVWSSTPRTVRIPPKGCGRSLPQWGLWAGPEAGCQTLSRQMEAPICRSFSSILS